MAENKLSMRVKLGYGVCDLGGNLFFTVIAFLFLNYLTDTVGINPGVAGMIIMIGKIWDAITDPLVGYLSDKTQSRWGRRRPYIFFGSFPLFIAMILMFTNPNLSSQTQLFVWGVGVFCLLCTAYTLVNIPYNSLTPELTKDFHERSVLNGYRFGFAVIGTLLGAGAALPMIQSFTDRDFGFSVMGTTFGFIMMITALATFFVVKEQKVIRPEQAKGFFASYSKVFKNKPYVIILLTYTLQIAAITVTSGIIIYYFKYLHNDESKTQVAMVILLLTAMVFIPVSVKLAKRWGKKPVYALGMAIFAVSIMIIFYFGHLFAAQFSLMMMFPSGIGLGLIYALPYAIVPDAVEYDYLLSGERTEGAFYGIWTFGTKIGQAAALGITGLVLSLTGYVPNVVQASTATFGIRLLVGPISSILFILAIITLYYYPINEKRYNEIITEIEARDSK